MLSFGIEYEARLLDRVLEREVGGGIAATSFAATMIARESFEKSLPRFASAAPFLCLMVDHLLCPDTRRLRHQLEEPFVDAWIVGELRVERGDQDPPVAQEHRLPVELASTSTSGPNSRTRGARMKTPRNGRTSPSSERSASKLATCRP